MTDRIRFQCANCGQVLPSFSLFHEHIGNHLRVQAAPLRTLRRTVRANKLMLPRPEPRETGAGHFPYLFEKVPHD